MTQSSDNPTKNLPPVKIQPTLKMALYIQLLQNSPPETPDDWETAIKAWDENGLILKSYSVSKVN